MILLQMIYILVGSPTLLIPGPGAIQLTLHISMKCFPHIDKTMAPPSVGGAPFGHHSLNVQNYFINIFKVGADISTAEPVGIDSAGHPSIECEL